MRRAMIFVAILAALVGSRHGAAQQAVVISSEPSELLGPCLRFVPNDTVQFGLISGKEMVQDTIRLVNDGDEPLLLLHAHADCSCTVTRYPKTPIAPGDTAKIMVRFDPRNRSHGRFTKFLRFRTNGTPTTAVVYIKGRIARPTRK